MYLKTGAGTTASRIGQPDLAIAQLHEMRENAEMIANLDPFGPPLIADMDTGYGGKPLRNNHLSLYGYYEPADIANPIGSLDFLRFLNLTSMS